MQAQNTISSISIIIPTLNEEGNIERTLRSIPPAPEVEILVVDGGSNDATVEKARRCGVCVLSSMRGRARQMNRGAAVAKGELLIFLHADTRLPEGFDYPVRRILMNPEVAAGAFRLHIDGSARGLWLIESAANWRSRWMKMPYGDQAIFLRACTFHDVGGYPEQPIMEDYELIKCLRQRGRIVTAELSVTTSARRWETLGLVRTTVINQLTILGYELGISPTRLAQWYHRK